MEAVVEVFKDKYEKRLFRLYDALDNYFVYRRIGCVSTPTDFHSQIGSIVPLLFQCAIMFWCRSDYSKKIKLPNTFKKL